MSTTLLWQPVPPCWGSHWTNTLEDNLITVSTKSMSICIVTHWHRILSSSHKIKDLDKLVLDAEESDSILLTTEKDYFRINEEYKKKIKYIKVEIEIERKEDFVNLIKKTYEKN